MWSLGTVSTMYGLCEGFISFPPFTWLPLVPPTVLEVSCNLDLMQLRTTSPEEDSEILLAQALLCLMADAVCLLLSLHWLMFRLWGLSLAISICGQAGCG